MGEGDLLHITHSQVLLLRKVKAKDSSVYKGRLYELELKKASLLPGK